MQWSKYSIIFILIMLIIRSDGSDTNKKSNFNVSEEIAERFENIKKSPRDRRSYRGLVLRNNLRVFLISDPETDKGAASLSISVGGIHDYDELPGIAHFLEHMLFMGSKKYPKENHFSKFIRDHAGIYNGQTGEGWQNYFFDVSSDNLAEALDIFAQFFLEPLMDPSTTAREVNAVESEHSMYRANDGWRVSHLLNHISKPGHPHSRFFCGNLKSLHIDPQAKGIDVRKKLLELHSTWYSSNIMNLAVLGKESLDDLEKMVVPLFMNIENKNVPRKLHSEHPWGPEQLKNKIYTVPISDLRYLLIRFPLPSVVDHYETAPLEYISELLGHEGPGSLLAELKDRNWGDSLSTGYEGIPGFSFLDVQIDLTEEGMNHIDEIVKLMFQYLHLLKTKGVQEWFFKELKKTRMTTFLFKDKESPLDYVYHVASALIDHPFEDVLSYHFHRNQWKPALIEEFLNYLSPDNMNILIVSKDFENHTNLQSEPWHDTKYKIHRIPDDFIKKMWNTTTFHDKFHLPPPNEFIVDKFDLHPLDEDKPKHPRLIHESQISQIWFKQDDEFKLPSLYIKLNLFSPLSCESVNNVVLTDLFVRLFKRAFVTYGYAAATAGLEWSVHPVRCGLHIHLSGYSDKLPILLKRFLSEMVAHEIKKKDFELAKEALIRKFKNFATDQPYTQAQFYLFYLLDNTTCTHEELLDGAQDVQVDDMEQFKKQLFKRVFIQGLIYGNCHKKQAKDIIDIIESSFKLISDVPVSPHEIELPPIIKMDDESEYVFKVPHAHHESSCYSAYFQFGADHPIKNAVLSDLFLEIVNEKCFQTLRTEAQLGYVAFCKGVLKNGVLGLWVTVQSEKHPTLVNSKVEQFLHDLQKTLSDMTEAEFETHKTSLKDRYLEKIIGQDEQFRTYWDEITDRRYHFQKQNVKAELLNSLKKKDILDFYQKHISKSSDKRKKLNIHIISNKTNPAVPSDVATKGSTIENATVFRDNSNFFPQPHSYMEVPPVGFKTS